MILGFIEDAIENVLDCADDILDGEMPSKRNVAKLISDGLTVAAVASAYGVAEDVIEKILED